MRNWRRPGRARVRGWGAAGCAILLLGVFAGPAAAEPETQQGFDFDTGNAVSEVVFPASLEKEYAISPAGSDPSLILHFVVQLEVAWFDAIAPYHPTATGIYSDLGRRPAGERTTRNRNIAIMYASYRVLNEFLPQFSADWRAMLESVGLDPDDDQEDPRTAVGLGNLAARRVLEARANDGLNRLGNEGGVTYHTRPYADYTGYRPVNTAYRLRDPGRWQPAVVASPNGTFRVQQFVTPQMRLTEAFTFGDPAQFRLAPPRDSDPRRRAAYRRQADQILAASAGLTDRQKMAAELFDDKIISLGLLAGSAAAHAGGFDVQELVHYLTTVNIATFDAAIAVWHQKVRYDAVRPFSAIAYLYGDAPVTAWGGPGQGTVSDLPGNQWRSYMPVGDHPEYPSVSTSLCLAYTQAARRALGTDKIDIVHSVEAGSSAIEPGVTPASDLTLRWDTWTDFAADCGQSRVWAGVHFPAAVENVADFAPRFGDRAHAFVQRHLAGHG